MRIATLQFSPKLGAVKKNMARADAVLSEAKPSRLHLLVLPEMAFTGYNFPSLEAITPYLEPTANGPSTLWAMDTAKKYNCHVSVGYPEVVFDVRGHAWNYNATVLIAPGGVLVAHTRKRFLYYTDETWAGESPTDFFAGSIPILVPDLCGIPNSNASIVAMGICMDINPYKFTAPFTDYEFAMHCIRYKVRLVMLSMAWLSRLLPRDAAIRPEEPDMETVAYWVERFHPLRESSMEEPVVIIFANRSGSEGIRTELALENGEIEVESAKLAYAGTSCVMVFHRGEVKILDMLGKGEEKMLFVDTESPAKYALQQKSAA